MCLLLSLKKCLFIQVAKENDQLNNRLHTLTLALIEAHGLEQLLSTLHDELHSQFRADAVELKLFSADEVENAVDDPALKVFQVFMEADRPTCEPGQDRLSGISRVRPPNRTHRGSGGVPGSLCSGRADQQPTCQVATS